MLYYCAFTWHSHTTREKVVERIAQQDALGTLKREHVKGWYTLAGGGAGFMLLETDTPQELNQILTPYMDLMSWDVRAIFALDFDTVMANARQTQSGAAGTR